VRSSFQILVVAKEKAWFPALSLEVRKNTL